MDSLPHLLKINEGPVNQLIVYEVLNNEQEPGLSETVIHSLEHTPVQPVSESHQLLAFVTVFELLMGHQ